MVKKVSWCDAIKYLIQYRIKATTHTRRIITVKRVLDVGESYLFERFPDNNNIDASIKKTLNKLTQSGYLKRVKRGWKINTHYNKPLVALPVGIGKAKFGNVAIEIDLKNGLLYANLHGMRCKVAEVIG